MTKNNKWTAYEYLFFLMNYTIEYEICVFLIQGYITLHKVQSNEKRRFDAVGVKNGSGYNIV